jgi:hypothetical protein
MMYVGGFWWTGTLQGGWYTSDMDAPVFGVWNSDCTHNW